VEKINALPVRNIILLPDSFAPYVDKFQNKNIFQVDSMKQAVKIAKEKTEK
jgi:hypothetical protein